MLVSVPLVDYLRLGSWDSETIAELHVWVRRLGAGELDDEARWLQYRGVQSDEAFAGVADQNGRMHGLLDVSGELAQAAMSRGFESVSCTRIDLQITVPLVDGYRARHFADELRAVDWSAVVDVPRVRRRSVTVVENDEGLDTVYIGSRQSDRFCRVYVKEDEDGGRYLRFETEFKGDRADRVYRMCLDDGRQVASILLGEFKRLPLVDVPTWPQVKEVLLSYVNESVSVSVPRVQSTAETKFRWFVDACLPVLRWLLHNHSTAHKVRHLLVELLESTGGFRDA